MAKRIPQASCSHEVHEEMKRRGLEHFRSLTIPHWVDILPASDDEPETIYEFRECKRCYSTLAMEISRADILLNSKIVER